MARWCRGYWSSQGRVEKGWNWVAECNNLRERYTRKNVLFLRWRESATFPRMFSSSAVEVFKISFIRSATFPRMFSSSADEVFTISFIRSLGPSPRRKRPGKGWNWVAECNNLGGAYIRKNVFFLRWRGERYIPKNVFFLRCSETLINGPMV